MSIIQVDQTKVKSIKNEEAERERKAAYAAEADPLFFKWQAGEATEAQWKAKRDEIKQRFAE